MLLYIRSSELEPLLFTTIYRRLKGGNFNVYIDELTKFSHKYKRIIFTGDLNCNLLTSTYEPNRLRDVTSLLIFRIVSSESTYHSSHSDSWLDVFIDDSLDKIIFFKKSAAAFINGHDLIKLAYSFEGPSDGDQVIIRHIFIVRDPAARYILSSVFSLKCGKKESFFID